MTAESSDRNAIQEKATAAYIDLVKWRGPAEFAQLVRQIDSGVKSSELLRLNEFKFLTEALALADFVEFYPVEAVRLKVPHGQHPDSFIRVAGEEIEVEITQALNQERRRGDEHAENAPSVERVTQEEMEARRGELEPALTKAIEKKLNRGNHRAILLVYVELQIHFPLSADEEALIRDIKESYRTRFRDIYIICKGNIY